QRGLDVLADLADLGAHVALAHHVAVAVARELAGDEDQALAFDRDHVGVECMAAADRGGERIGMDVLAGDGHAGLLFLGGRALQAVPPSNGRPTASVRRRFSSRFMYAASGAAPTPSRTLLKKQRAAAANAMSRMSVSENPWRRSSSRSPALTPFALAAIFSAKAIMETSAGGRPACR